MEFTHQHAVKTEILLKIQFVSFLDLDSFGKPGDGILQGHLRFFGMYDECVNISIPMPGAHNYATGSQTDEGDVFITTYCNLNIPLKLLPPSSTSGGHNSKLGDLLGDIVSNNTYAAHRDFSTVSG